MVRNKTYLYFSIILLVIVCIIIVPFPNRYSVVEKWMHIFNIPTGTGNGVSFLGILSIIILIASLTLLRISLKKYRGRMIIVAILSIYVIPAGLITLYQSTFAKGIYAVSYHHEESTCSFEEVREKTLTGECALHFKNHSNADVDFTLKFQEVHMFDDDIPMIELMNREGPYEIQLSGHEQKVVYIDALLDMSNEEQYIHSGEANGVDIVISADGKEREL